MEYKVRKTTANLRKNIFYPKRTLPVTFLSINFLITLGCSCKLQSDVLRKTNFVLVMLNILCSFTRSWAFLPVGALPPERGMKGTQGKPSSPGYSGSLNKTHCCKRRVLGCLVYRKLTHLLSVISGVSAVWYWEEGWKELGISMAPVFVTFISYINSSFNVVFPSL